LISVHRPGEQAPRQIDVSQDQMRRAHPAQRSYPHRGVRCLGEDLFRHRLSVRKREGVGFRDDGEGIFENCVSEVHRGVAQPHLGDSQRVRRHSERRVANARVAGPLNTVPDRSTRPAHTNGPKLTHRSKTADPSSASPWKVVASNLA
jgi:hypothetical protein